VNVGALVVVPAEPALGVGRVERLLDGGSRVRILLYARLGFVVRALADVKPCPPGVWSPTKA